MSKVATVQALVKRSKIDGTASLTVQNRRLLQHALAKLKDGDIVELVISTKGKRALRTEQQNRALHLYFDLVAKELNDGGYTVQKVLREKLELSWTPEFVKDMLWRPAQMALLRKESTTQLSKQEDIDTVYDHLNRHLGEKFGIHVGFPSHEAGYWETAPLKSQDPSYAQGKPRAVPPKRGKM